MIDFMVIGLPRSGTAWLANWFTTERSLCWHESLMKYRLDELDAMPHAGYFGIAETALCLASPAGLNEHKAKKLIVHRPLNEVNESLSYLDLPAMDWVGADNLNQIAGFHIDFKDLFNAEKFRAAHESIMPTSFDGARFAFLRDMNIQNQAAIEGCQKVFNG